MTQSRKMNEWTPNRIYWDIFLHLSMVYKGNIRFSKEYEANIQKHVEELKNKDG